MERLLWNGMGKKGGGVGWGEPDGGNVPYDCDFAAWSNHYQENYGKPRYMCFKPVVECILVYFNYTATVDVTLLS